MADYDIWHIYDDMEKYLVASMSRNLKRHTAEEAEYGFDWEQWQAAKLREMRKFRKQNQKIIGKHTKNLPKDIKQHLENEYKQGLVGTIKKYKEVFGDTAITKDLSDGFFGTNDKKIQALIDAVNNDLKNANHAALRMANDAYRQTIHKAAMFASNGVMTEKQAIQMAIDEFANRGLNCIKYSNGARHNIKEYTQMAVRTAETRAMLMGEGKARQELGETLVQITKHGTACPLCVPFENKVLIDDVYSGGTWENSKEAYEKVPKAKRAAVRFMSEAMKEGLYHPRCRHGLGTFYVELLEDNEPRQVSHAEQPKAQHIIRKANNAIIAAKSIVDAIDKDAPIPKLVGTVNKQDADKTLDEWMLKIGKQDYETAIVIDSSGNMYKIDGETSTVNIEGLSAAQLTGASMIHNHPDEKTHYSFSAADIAQAIKYRFATMRGFDSEYEYIYKTLDETLNMDEDIVKYEFSRKYANKALEKAFNRKLNMDTDEYHYILTEMAKEYGFFYERKKR